MPLTLRGRFYVWITVLVLLVPAKCASFHMSSRELSSQSADLNIRGDQYALTSHIKSSNLQHLTSAQLKAWSPVSHFAALSEKTADTDTVLSSLNLYSAALIVVPGTRPPDRPDNHSAMPFLTLVEGEHQQGLFSALPLGPINKAAATMAAVLRRPMYPFRLQVLDFNKTGVHAPWAVYHVPSSTVYLDQQLVENMQTVPLSIGSFVGDFAEQMFNHLSGMSTSAGNSIQASDASSLAQSFSTAAASAAGLALASQIPLWFCIACPIVLGMLFPFAFNFGLGAIADELCTYYNLPSDECTELWYSAFALAMILSFASVIPIVSICRLPQCAKPSSPGPGL